MNYITVMYLFQPELPPSSGEYDILRLLTGVLICAGIGVFMGLEREYSHKKDEEVGKDELMFAGIRTFPIVCLLGYTGMFLAELYSIWVFIILLAGVLSFTGIFYYKNISKGNAGSTSEFAIIISFVLGALIFLDYIRFAVAIGVLVTLFLALKVKLHMAVGKLDREDIFALIKFVIMAALVLPLLPNEEYGPYGVLNPRSIGLIIVLLTAINFSGYLLGKFIDKGKSIIFTGILGGFLSSTAVTWHFARSSKSSKANPDYNSAAIILASSIMFLRVAVLLFILNRELFTEIFAGMVILCVIGILAGVIIVKRAKPGSAGEGMVSKNPLNLTEALKFGVIYTVILLLVGFAKENMGDSAIYIVSGVSGLTDVDAVVISMANLGGVTLDMGVALIGVAVAVISNTFVKYLICLVFGSGRLKKLVSFGFIGIFMAFALYLGVKEFLF